MFFSLELSVLILLNVFHCTGELERLAWQLSQRGGDLQAVCLAENAFCVRFWVLMLWYLDELLSQQWQWQVTLVFWGGPFLSHVRTTAFSSAWSCVRLLRAAMGDPLAFLSMKLCVSFLKESHCKGETLAPLMWLEKMLSISHEGHSTVGKYRHRDSRWLSVSPREVTQGEFSVPASWIEKKCSLSHTISKFKCYPKSENLELVAEHALSSCSLSDGEHAVQQRASLQSWGLGGSTHNTSHSLYIV